MASKVPSAHPISTHGWKWFAARLSGDAVARAKTTLLWNERKGNRRAKSFSSVERMERVCGEKLKSGEVLRERGEKVESAKDGAERRSVRRV